jgi:hypothetical protein
MSGEPHPDREALESRRSALEATEKILKILEPLDRGLEEAEALIAALILIGASNAAAAALRALGEDDFG